MFKKYELTTAILQNTVNFHSNFKLFFLCLMSRNFHTKYNFLIAFEIRSNFLTLSISTKNLEKLNQIGFNLPLTYRSSLLIVQWTRMHGQLAELTQQQNFCMKCSPHNCLKSFCHFCGQNSVFSMGKNSVTYNLHGQQPVVMPV